MDDGISWFLFNAFKNNVIVFTSVMILQNGLALVLAVLLARRPLRRAVLSGGLFSASHSIDRNHSISVEADPEPGLRTAEQAAQDGRA